MNEVRLLCETCKSVRWSSSMATDRECITCHYAKEVRKEERKNRESAVGETRHSGEIKKPSPTSDQANYLSQKLLQFGPDVKGEGKGDSL